MSKQSLPSGLIRCFRHCPFSAASCKTSYAFSDRIDIDGFDHPKKVFDIAEALIRRGYSDTDIEKVPGGNFRRLLGQVIG